MLKTLAIIISRLQGCGLFLFPSLNFLSRLYHEPFGFYNQKKKCFHLISFKYTTLNNHCCSQFQFEEGPTSISNYFAHVTF